MKVYCTNCGHAMDVPESVENQTVRCEACGYEYTAPPSSRRQSACTGSDFNTMPGGQSANHNGRESGYASSSISGADMATIRFHEFRAGELIADRYEILSELGRGGMGVVYKCLDKVSGLVVALKALPPELSRDKSEMLMVRNNFTLVNNLNHPNIAAYKTLEYDSKTENYYLVMECVEGEDLRSWIVHNGDNQGRLNIIQILPIIRQIADALDYAHGERIIHRDIKPGNFMVESSGRIKVLDFGLAAQIHTSLSRVSMQYNNVSGTGPYMAPEQWRGRRQTASTDQYALAVMIYEMLAGYAPFEAADISVLRHAVLEDEAESIPDVPDFVQSAVKRAMNKDPKQRYASCAEFVKALEGKNEPLESTSAVKQESKETFANRNISETDRHKPEKVSNGLPSQSVEVEQQKNFPKKKRHYIWISILFVLLFAVIAGVVGYNNNQEKQRYDWSGYVEPNENSPSGNQKKQGNSGITSAESNRTFTVGNGVALDMVYVSAGSFTMGSGDSDAYSNETPHTVTLTKDYWIGKYEVTQEQYEAVMGTNPSKFKKGAKYPVEEVSWNDAQSFCRKLNSKLSSQLPAGYEFRLPTEAEWEYAARGGKKSKGYKYSGSNDVGSVAWYDDNSGDTTHPVGGISQNELGIYDMSGNVWEWCLDYCNWSSGSGVETDTYRYNIQDPLCTTGSYRVLRGGSWIIYAGYCRVSGRLYCGPSFSFNYLGFRLALAPCR